MLVVRFCLNVLHKCLAAYSLRSHSMLSFDDNTKVGKNKSLAWDGFNFLSKVPYHLLNPVTYESAFLQPPSIHAPTYSYCIALYGISHLSLSTLHYHTSTEYEQLELWTRSAGIRDTR